MKSVTDPLPGVRMAAMLRLSPEDQLASFRTASPDRYEIRVFMAAGEIVSSFEELEQVVQMLPRITTFQELSALLKLYIIGWMSLSDMAANLINEVYNLGYAERDVEFNAMLRNRHVRSTSIPELVKKHGTSVRHEYFSKRRNDIVHRGKLRDLELTHLGVEWSRALLAATHGIDRSDLSAMEAASHRAAAACNLRTRMSELVAARSKEYTQHLESTRALLTDLASVLVVRINDEPRAA